MSQKVAIFDSSLRDGAQAEGISFSVEDKLKILALLDDHGIDYVEAGNPGSNPKDLEFFERARNIPLRHTRLAAFGSTRRRDIQVEEDANVQSMLLADTPVVVIFGKSWDFHVTDIIRTTLTENLAMIRETLAFFKARGKEVVYDAEHFFDGYKNNPQYALLSLQAAVDGGADCLVLCDTNGGTFPSEIAQIVQTVAARFAQPPSAFMHIMIVAWLSPTASPQSKMAHDMCKAPISALANAVETPIWRPSSPIWASSATINVCRRTSTATSPAPHVTWRPFPT